MRTDRVGEREVSKEQVLAEARRNPEIRARMDELEERVRSGKAGRSPGIRGEELAQFLRDHQ
jgi:hypothetical protein